METLQVHHPRLVLYGLLGMGQGYVGAASLHFSEGYHVQRVWTLVLGTSVGESMRVSNAHLRCSRYVHPHMQTTEVAIVQRFVEARRQPSVLSIPALSSWSAALSDTARSTVRAMLNSLSLTDSIVLLAVSDSPFSSP